MLESVLTCQHCGFATREAMPTDACQFFYECRNMTTTRIIGLVQVKPTIPADERR